MTVDRAEPELELIAVPPLPTSLGTSQSGPAVVTPLGMTVPGGQPRGRIPVVIIVVLVAAPAAEAQPAGQDDSQSLRPSKEPQRVFRMANLPCRDPAGRAVGRVDDDPDRRDSETRNSTPRDKNRTAEENAAGR